MVAHEMIRETVNFNCDRRRTVNEIMTEHTHVDFSSYSLETQETPHHDAIWEYYEVRFGCDETFQEHRESGEIHVVADRGRSFFQWLLQQPQQHIVICTHSAFLRCIKNFGHLNEVEEDDEGSSILGVPRAPPQHGDQPNVISPVLKYSGDTSDDRNHNDFAKAMKKDYANCELRSMILVG
jgi:hypothetical protein